ncbi:MAG: endolytic transglycosylase MltG [Bacteroidales bacterium]|nr:endolytic transglycosylase MltG [Bacteroidales bacterium]
MEYYHSKYSRGQIKRRSRFSRFIIYFLMILIVAALVVGYQLYKTILKPNTWVADNTETSIYIPTGSSYDDMKTILYEHGIVINRISFEWLAKKKNLPNNVHPGRYLVKDGMSNDQLINLLRSGEQTPVKVIFNNIRTKDQLANVIAQQIEPDSLEILSLLKDTAYIRIFGFNPETILSMFIPNTYEMYWNTSSRNFMERMYTEYNKFWTKIRIEKAEEIGLDPEEVSVLASIVEKETNKNDEKATIAGVYLNRLKYGWRMQADPTVVFAWGDFSIKRVLNIHKQIDSPYNTYLYSGLPPGPICIPSISSIDAVLNREDHNYMFFCAKDDFSGYHVFASTHAQHSINANKYRQALDEREIRN